MKASFALLILLPIICAHFIIPDLDIKSTIDFSKTLTDISSYKWNAKNLQNVIIKNFDEDSSWVPYYMGFIDKTTLEIINKTNLHHSDTNNDCFYDEEENLKLTLTDYFDVINSLWSAFESKLKNSTDDWVLCSASWTNEIPKGTNLLDSVKSIQELIGNINLNTIFNDIIWAVNNAWSGTSKEKYCDANSSVHQKLIAIYHLMAAVEKKLFVLSSFVYLIRGICSPDNNIQYLRTPQQLLIRRTQGYLISAKLALPSASRDLYRCDYTKYQIEPYFYELEGFKRTVITYEQYHSADNSCLHRCADINDNLSISDVDFAVRKDYCPGRLDECQFRGNMEICLLPSESSKLYQWFKDSSGTIYGNNSECLGNLQTMKSYNWSINTNFNCDPCICTCTHDATQSPSRYAISLIEEESDIYNNKVVTGIKFVMDNHVIYPQIETGKLLANGCIEADSNKWKTINVFSNNKNGIDLENNKKYSGRQKLVYFGGNADDAHYINLGGIYLEDEYVVTGVKFSKFSKYLPGSKQNTIFISLALQATHYDISTGQLSKYPTDWITTNRWQSQYGSSVKRRELRLPNSDNPLNYQINLPNSNKGDYVKFWTSDLKNDAGQTTVPFFDAIPVFGIPRFPLGGLGIHHKGPRKSGGFLAFKIIGTDLSQFIITEIPMDEKVLDPNYT